MTPVLKLYHLVWEHRLDLISTVVVVPLISAPYIPSISHSEWLYGTTSLGIAMPSETRSDTYLSTALNLPVFTPATRSQLLVPELKGIWTFFRHNIPRYLTIFCLWLLCLHTKKWVYFWNWKVHCASVLVRLLPWLPNSSFSSWLFWERIPILEIFNQIPVGHCDFNTTSPELHKQRWN